MALTELATLRKRGVVGSQADAVAARFSTPASGRHWTSSRALVAVESARAGDAIGC